MRKAIPLLLIVAGYAFSAVAYSHLAPQVTPRFDTLVPWVDPADIEAVPRAFAAFGVPTLALLLWLLLRAGATAAAERAGKRVFPGWLVSDRTGSAAVERFGPTFDVILAIIVSCLLLFHAVMLGTVLDWPQWTVRLFTAFVGVSIMMVGNIMPRTRPNWIAGLRTRRTLSDPDVWRRTHRYFGALLMATGIAVILASLFSAPYALLVAVAGSLFAAITASIFGGRTGRRDTLPALGVSVALVMGVAGTLGAQTTDPAADPGYVEAPFEVTSGDLVLHGTLTIPDPAPAPHAVAVIVAGSGPTDRDGNGPLVQTDMYAQLAHGLADRGIASVRYDKRGIGPGALTIDHTALTLDDYVNDVLAVARVLAADPRFSRVFLVGHSEGAGLVLQAANRGAPAAGVVMISGMGRPLVEVLHDQFLLLTDSLTTHRIDEAFQRYLEGDDVLDAPEIARPVLVPHYRRLMASMAAYDPEGEIARAAVPILIVQGGMDIQVGTGDAERLREAQPAASFLLIPEANHVFKAASSRDPAAQQPLYMDRAIPVVPELADGVANWIAP